jgi:hypothetical protein
VRRGARTSCWLIDDRVVRPSVAPDAQHGGLIPIWADRYLSSSDPLIPITVTVEAFEALAATLALPRYKGSLRIFSQGSWISAQAVHMHR